MIKRLLIILMAAMPAFSALAVTDKEMEQAKTIAAKAYLRYANDGSGYLDDVKATTMSELQSKLKAKEKENLKAFNSVKIPGDYASWDKAKLVEFWSITFFTSPNLSDKGKIARSTVKKRISAMNVSAPAPAAPKEPEKPEATAPAATPEAAPAQPSATAPAAEEVPSADAAIEKQEEILADQNAIAQAEEETRLSGQKDDNTWIYVIVLVILVGVVVWLVVFAANMMKKQKPADDSDGTPNGSGASDSELRAQFSKAMAKKNEELKGVADRLELSENEQARLMRTVENLKEENLRLKEEIARLKSQVRQQPSAAPVEAAPVAREMAAAPQPERRMPNVIYLGRANSRGLFVRADRRITPGHTIYRLDTRDGLVGTFHVVDEPEVTEVALNNPVEYLAGGCNAIDIEDTAGATRIVTENAGTALFEDGKWKVLRKSRIRYE